MSFERRDKNTGIYVRHGVRAGYSPQELKKKAQLEKELQVRPKNIKAARELSELNERCNGDMYALLKEVGPKINDVGPRFLKWLSDLSNECESMWKVESARNAALTVAEGTRHMLAAEPEPTEQDRDYRDILVRAKFLCDAIANGDARSAALNGYWLGGDVERLHVRPFEAMVLRDSSRQRGCSKGGQTMKGRANESRPNWQELVSACKRRDPDCKSVTELCRRAARTASKTYGHTVHWRTAFDSLPAYLRNSLRKA